MAGIAALAMAAALCGAGPLEILLTNDDGVDAAGLRALRAQLVAAGHRVTVAAPDHNASGSALSFDWGTVRVTRDPSDPALFAIGGSPATAVALAAGALYPAGRRPDLVVSGINHGPNSGSLLALSGTLGAALAGTLLLDPPVPGIAVSAARLRGAQPPDSDENRRQFEEVGAHASRLVAAVRGWFCDGDATVRNRTVLNVNYPARPIDELRGTVVADQGQAASLRVHFVEIGPGEYRARVERLEPADARPADTYWLDQGYVTVTPVGGDIAQDALPRAGLARRLRGL